MFGADFVCCVFATLDSNINLIFGVKHNLCGLGQEMIVYLCYVVLTYVTQ